MDNRIYIIMLGVLLLSISSLYAVQLSIGTVGAAGGTGDVSVSSPEDDSTINSLYWTVDSSGFINGVNIEWDPSTTGTFTVSIQVKDSASTIIASGSATVDVSDASLTYTTSISFSNSIDPKDVYYVSVQIVQTG